MVLPSRLKEGDDFVKELRMLLEKDEKEISKNRVTDAIVNT